MKDRARTQVRQKMDPQGEKKSSFVPKADDLTHNESEPTRMVKLNGINLIGISEACEAILDGIDWESHTDRGLYLKAMQIKDLVGQLKEIIQGPNQLQHSLKDLIQHPGSLISHSTANIENCCELQNQVTRDPELLLQPIQRDLLEAPYCANVERGKSDINSAVDRVPRPFFRRKSDQEVSAHLNQLRASRINLDLEASSLNCTSTQEMRRLFFESKQGAKRDRTNTDNEGGQVGQTFGKETLL